MAPPTKTIAAQVRDNPFAASGENASVANVFATPVTLARYQANTVNAMTSPVFATKENYAQVRVGWPSKRCAYLQRRMIISGNATPLSVSILLKKN